MKHIFVNQNQISGDSVLLDFKQHVHFSQSARGKTGDKLNVVCDDILYNCVVKSITKKQTELTILKLQKWSEQVCNITLYIAKPKADKLETIIQKCCELGVKQIVIFNSAHSQNTKINLQRLNSIALEACQQSGRYSLLQIISDADFNQMLQMQKQHNHIVFAYENEKNLTLANSLKNITATDFSIIIGSEGGFSDTEASLIAKIATPVTLGNNVLRCETAAIAVVSFVMLNFF